MNQIIKSQSCTYYYYITLMHAACKIGETDKPPADKIENEYTGDFKTITKLN